MGIFKKLADLGKEKLEQANAYKDDLKRAITAFGNELKTESCSVQEKSHEIPKPEESTMNQAKTNDGSKTLAEKADELLNWMNHKATKTEKTAIKQVETKLEGFSEEFLEILEAAETRNSRGEQGVYGEVNDNPCYIEVIGYYDRFPSYFMSNFFSHEEKNRIQMVAITNGPKTIGNSMFSGFSSLKEVNIPDSVEEIGEDAFCGCERLESIVIPDSVTEIGRDAFEGCTGLKSVTIPDSVTEIGGDAFEGCTGLKSVTIPDSVKEIGSSAFYGCKRLESITIPDSVIEIGDLAFSNCTKLTSIVIPNSIEEIKSCTFQDCESLKSVIFQGAIKALKTIGSSAFYGCKRLESITIPGSVEEIGENAFSGCERLESIVIPDSVKEIGAGAFEGCRSLKSLVLPSGFTNEQGFRCPENLVKLDLNKCHKLRSIQNIIVGGEKTREIIFPNGLEEIEDSVLEVQNETAVFLPPTIEKIGSNCCELWYCFAPKLETLDDLKGEIWSRTKLYVLPQYVDYYKSQRDAEQIDAKLLEILPIPDEYLYYYDVPESNNKVTPKSNPELGAKAVEKPETMTCPNCHIEVTSKFCPNCGSKPVLARHAMVCPNCHIEVTSKFCPECGAKSVETFKA